MKTKTTHPTDPELDRILADEEELLPTSGFLAAVMERVEAEAAAPAPIPFPRKRMLAACVLALVVFAWAGYALFHLAMTALPDSSPSTVQLPMEWMHLQNQAGWVGMALGTSWLSWLLAKRLTRSGGLL